MVLIEWRKSLSVDINEIDEQHKKLFGYMNSLYDALVDKREKEVLFQLFKDLEDYTKTHFSIEEKYFKKFNYKDTGSHIIQHTYFINRLSEMKDKINRGFMDAEDLLEFLVTWFMNHIKKVDHQYVECFHEHGVY